MKRAHPTMPLQIKVALAAAVLGLAAWWLTGWSDLRANEARLGAIASELAGRDVRVQCPGPIGRMFGWDIVEGSVRFDADGTPHDETKIRKQSCAELDALAEGRRAKELSCIGRTGIACGRNGRELVMAVDVLAHEAWHLRGVIDEGETECRSLQTMAWTAQQLGATAEQGHAMARAQYDGAFREMPAHYQHAGCTDGGPLDLRPNDPAFP
jgi:hypothetical protein